MVLTVCRHFFSFLLVLPVAIECVIQEKKIMVDRLRFHLTQEACQQLIGSNRISSADSLKILEEFSKKESKERTHALLGQDILRHYTTIQTKDCVAVIHDADTVPSFKYLNLVLKEEGDIGVSSWRGEFMDAEDDDHDGDDCYVMIDSPRDDYAF